MSSPVEVKKLTFVVSPKDLGKRLDVFVTDALAALPEEEHAELFGTAAAISRSRVGGLIKNGQVSKGGVAVIKPGAEVLPGENFEVCILPAPTLELRPDDSIPLAIVYEDDSILVINKQAGLVVHPGAGVQERTLVHALLSYLGSNIQPIGDALRPGIVHRLDKDTTGLMVVAKDEESYRDLVKQFLPPRTVSRTYLALVLRMPKGARDDRGEIDLAIGRSSRDRTKMAVQRDGREAKTLWRVARRLERGLLLELELATGRTHQIRVHLQAAGASIVGDPTYGPRESDLPLKLRPIVRDFGRQALHATKLSFRHPRSGDVVSFSAELPEDFSNLLEYFARAEGA